MKHFHQLKNFNLVVIKHIALQPIFTIRNLEIRQTYSGMTENKTHLRRHYNNQSPDPKTDLNHTETSKQPQYALLSFCLYE